MEIDIIKGIAVVAGVLGFNEMRVRWLKKSQEVHEKQMNQITRDLDRHYMTKDETLQMYSMLNQANEVKFDAFEKRQVAMDKKIDRILDMLDD